MGITQRRKRWLLSVGLLVLILMAVGYLCIGKSYTANAVAMAALESGDGITVSMSEDDLVVFAPEDPQVGLIFYPGGKVDHRAYAPLLRALAQEGVACVLTKMPFDLAVLDIDAARDARSKLPEIERWYIGGHSLGGAMAAAYAADHAVEYEGLILLAAYSTKDLSFEDLKVISLYGSEDKILNLDKYLAHRSNLPADTVEAVLGGGNHAQFGSYGEQKGDGSAQVSAEEQIDWTADVILKEIN